MTTLSQRLNGLASLIPTELHKEEVDTENEKSSGSLVGQYGTYVASS
jgi:hypothetical protein